MTVEEYRNRLMDAFHNADCDELIAVVVRPEESEFKHLEWLLKNHYHNQKQQPCEDCISREAVHSLMAMLLSDYLHDEDREKIELIDAEIAELPSVTPKQQPCDDAISRKDMLAVLRQSHSLTQAWDGFEKLPPVTPKEKTGWIPVSERLPEESKRYIVTTKYNDVMTDFYTGEGFLGDDIIAWMPLPEPYKEADNER